MGLRKKKLPEKRGSSIRLIVKSNNLVEARYMMNIWETRVFLTLLSMIGENDQNEEVYRIWFSDVRKKFCLKSNTSYEDLRMGAIGLTKKTVYLDWKTDDDFDRQITTHLVEGVDTLKAGQEHKKGVDRQQYIDLKLGSTIRPHLLEIKRCLLSTIKVNREVLDRIGVSGYTSYDMRNVVNLKPYGIRLFEILKKHERNGFWTVEVDRFRKMFMMDSEYKRFVHFFQAVVERSVNDINEHTDISVFNIEKIKTGRKIGRLKFYFRSKTAEEVDNLYRMNDVEITKQPQLQLELKEAPITEPNQTDILYQNFEEAVVKSFGVTPTVFIKMLASNQYKKEDIEQAIEVTRRAKYQQEIKKSVAGFFITALKEGFTDAKIESKKKQKDKTAKKVSLEQVLANINIEYDRRRQEKIKQLVSEESSVNEKALSSIINNPKKALLIRLKKLNIQLSDLVIQNFRDDAILRKFFISEIVELNKERFVDVEKWYKEQRAKALEEARK